MHNHRAVSLVEILVVIGVISILSLFIIGTFRDTRSGAHGVQCLANLRAHVGAAKHWSIENDNKFPSDRMRTELYPYLGIESSSVKTDTVMTCPGIQAGEYPTMAGMHPTYGMNQYLTSSYTKDGVSGQVFSWQKVRYYYALDYPERVFYFMDGQWKGSTDAQGYRNYRAMARIPNAGDMEFMFPHRNGMNVITVEGDARRISREEMFSPENQDTSSPGNHWGIPN